MKIFISALMMVFAVAASQAGFSSGSKGTTSANFLTLGVGARAIGLGEAYSAVADDATALYWNPAALRQVEKNSVALMHAAYLESTNFQYGAFAHSGEKSSLGLGVQYLSLGTLNGRDDSGFQTSEFKPSDLALTLGYAWDMGGFSVGASGKYVHSKIVDSATTGAVDFGVLSPLMAQDKLRFAFTASNIGGKIKYDQTSENLPLILKLGSRFSLSKAWLLSADAGFPRGNGVYGAAGTEYTFSIGRDMALAGRAGYNTRSAGDLSGFSGASFGAGFLIRNLTLDYGFVPFGDLGSAHRFSLSYGF